MVYSITTRVSPHQYRSRGKPTVPKAQKRIRSPLPKEKRCVKFAEMARGRPMLHLNDYTDEEIDACWYNHEDVTFFRDEARYIISMMEEEDSISDQQEMDLDSSWRSTRGLETYTTEGLQRKKGNRDFARTTVLNEQDRQYEQGIRDEEQISRLYRLCTFTSQAAAGMTGHEDANSTRERSSRNLVWLVEE